MSSGLGWGLLGLCSGAGDMVGVHVKYGRAIRKSVSMYAHCVTRCAFGWGMRGGACPPVRGDAQELAFPKLVLALP